MVNEYVYIQTIANKMFGKNLSFGVRDFCSGIDITKKISKLQYKSILKKLDIFRIIDR
jgi:hypothetical protein